MANGKLLEIAVREFGVAENNNLSVNQYYFVNKGDTLYSIARMHGRTVQELQTWNNLTNNNIVVGQSLRVAMPALISVKESRILQYARECGFDGILSEKDAWCSVAMNWVCKEAGLPRSGSASARSWLKVGTLVQNLHDADVVVYWRDSPDSQWGHVGIPFSYTADGKFINTYGGNQSDSWCVKPYPVERLLGFVKLA